MEPKSHDVNHFLPLRPLDFQVLTVLVGRELHGYGIVQATKDQFPDQPVLEIGSLYRILSRMLDQKWIREVGAPERVPKDRRVRRFYAATELGLAVIRAEANRMRALLASPAAALLLEPDP